MVITQEAAGLDTLDTARLVEDIYRDGIVSLPNILPVSWADQLDEDIGQQFLRALRVDGGEGVAFRGWSRYYIELYPERMRGFRDLIANPAIVALNREMLGDDYEIVELGADIPLPGAPEQPPHRDFPMPEPTRLHRRLTSLAYNASSVDVTPEMGPFNVAPGTHFDDGSEFKEGMFPVGELRAEYIKRMVPRLAKRGSVSARSGLTLHRGTLNKGRLRPVVILGVVSREDRAHSKTTVELLPGYVPPTLKMSREYYNRLPDEFKAHIRCEVVAQTSSDLPALKTHHGIEGLMMGKAPV
jgi:hypothetical protein